jgi:Flp pilus assembly protein CpaB
MSGPSLGSILATRQGSLMLALLCAVCAAGVLVFALGRYKSNVQQPVPQASVLVATGEIAKGTTGADIASQRLYKLEPVAATAVTPGALTDAAALGTETASSDILPGQQLTSADFATILNVGEALKHNQRGLEVTISESPGATDITQPGSRVDLYDTNAVPSGAAAAGGSGLTASAGSSSDVPAAAKLIASNVLVLKPATAIPVTIGNKSVIGSSLVFALSDNLVGAVISTAVKGGIYLALDPSTKPAPSNPTTPKAAAQ